jgi:hypothetical protein
MSESQRPTLGATRARQGRTGRQILWVLVFGVALVILGFALAYAWQSGGEAASQPSGRVSGQSFKAPPPTGATRQTPNQPQG